MMNQIIIIIIVGVKVIYVKEKKLSYNKVFQVINKEIK